MDHLNASDDAILETLARVASPTPSDIDDIDGIPGLDVNEMQGTDAQDTERLASEFKEKYCALREFEPGSKDYATIFETLRKMQERGETFDGFNSFGMMIAPHMSGNRFAKQCNICSAIGSLSDQDGDDLVGDINKWLKDQISVRRIREASDQAARFIAEKIDKEDDTELKFQMSGTIAQIFTISDRVIDLLKNCHIFGLEVSLPWETLGVESSFTFLGAVESKKSRKRKKTCK